MGVFGQNRLLFFHGKMGDSVKWNWLAEKVQNSPQKHRKWRSLRFFREILCSRENGDSIKWELLAKIHVCLEKMGTHFTKNILYWSCNAQIHIAVIFFSLWKTIRNLYICWPGTKITIIITQRSRKVPQDLVRRCRISRGINFHGFRKLQQRYDKFTGVFSEHKTLHENCSGTKIIILTWLMIAMNERAQGFWYR